MVGTVHVVGIRHISFKIEVHGNLVYISTHPLGGRGIVWDFENGWYTLVPFILLEYPSIQVGGSEFTSDCSYKG